METGVQGLGDDRSAERGSEQGEKWWVGAMLVGVPLGLAFISLLLLLLSTFVPIWGLLGSAAHVVWQSVGYNPYLVAVVVAEPVVVVGYAVVRVHQGMKG